MGKCGVVREETAEEIVYGLGGAEKCVRDRYTGRIVRGVACD